MNTSGSYEELFKVELAKYDQICEEVNKNVELQEQLLDQIKVGNLSSIICHEVPLGKKPKLILTIYMHFLR